MFYPNEMFRVTVVSHKSYMKETIRALYDAGVLHLREYVPSEGDYYPIGTPLENAEKISELLLILNSIKPQISLNGVPAKAAKFDPAKMEAFLTDMQAKTNRITADIKKTGELLKAGERKRDAIEFLSKAGVKRFDALKGYGSLEVLPGYAAKPETLKESLEGIDSEIMISEERTKSGFPSIIFVRKKDAEKAKSALLAAGFASFETGYEWKKTTPSEERIAFEADTKRLAAAADSLRKDLAGLAAEKGGELLGTENSLTAEIRKSEAPLKFAVSDHSFIVQGWVPKGNEGPLETTLAGITDKMYFHAEPVEEHEPAPVVLSNKGPLKPFEFFLRLYSLPKYKEIDPTFLVFLTFPIFFGIMLGDIGYGLVLLASFAFIRYKMKKMKSLASVLMMSSVITIVFGVIFGEFFGEEAILGYELHPMLVRSAGLGAMLPIAIIIGLVHVNTGILFSLVNEIREGKRKHALGKVSWFVLETGGILYLLSSFFKISTGVDPMISLGVFGAGVVLLMIGEGYTGVIEIPTLVSNVLSYARIAALGLASVSLAVVINDMAAGMFETGGLFIVMGIGLLIGGHAINTLLGLMGSFLQSLRLHYVEMFSKFYHGDGEPYKPFGT
jgi:V/A-type H+-transporting ATPase subunit I